LAPRIGAVLPDVSGSGLSALVAALKRCVRSVGLFMKSKG